MEPNGYRKLASFFLNQRLHGLSREGGRLICCGRAVCDVAENAQIRLLQDLVLGANLRRGSREETWLKVANGGQLTVTGRFQLYFGAGIEVFPGGQLTLGQGYLNTGGAIACTRSVRIGDGVFIGRNVYITDSDHHRLLDSEGVTLNGPSPVRIGSHVWIGFGAVILKGVTVGDGAVIAAGAVVTRDVPPGCLAAGVPARIIRENVLWK